MTVRVIDVETTGIDPKTDAIIEIASIDLTPAGYTNPIQTFVAPQRAVPPEASAVHHIIDDDLKDALSLGDAVKLFQEADLYVAHNAGFEKSFLPPIFGPWICTYKCALRLWPDAPSHGNQVLRYWLGLNRPFGVARTDVISHRASSDVLVTGAIVQRMFELAKLAQLKEWSEEPAVLPKIQFGKHKGMRVQDVDADYLQWIIRSDFDVDLKYTATKELERRNQLVKS